MVELLVRKELERQNQIKRQTDSQSIDPSTGAAEPQTLLAETVGEPSRKRKRQHTITTVKSVPETHDLIYNRAKMFLAAPAAVNPQFNNVPDAGLSMNSRREEHGNLAPPPSTQLFAPSKLSSLIRHPSHGIDRDTATDMPLSTQPFGMSRFGLARAHSIYEAGG